MCSSRRSYTGSGCELLAERSTRLAAVHPNRWNRHLCPIDEKVTQTGVRQSREPTRLLWLWGETSSSSVLRKKRSWAVAAENSKWPPQGGGLLCESVQGGSGSRWGSRVRLFVRAWSASVERAGTNSLTRASRAFSLPMVRASRGARLRGPRPGRRRRGTRS
jgi:hypothetical protein